MVEVSEALENWETRTIFCWEIETKDVVDCYTLISSRLNWGGGEYDILCDRFLSFSLLAVHRVQEETAPAERDCVILDFLKWDIK
jgi:hypothetical protein